MSIEFFNRHNTNSQKWDLYQGTDIIPLWVADTDAKVAPAITAAIHQRADHAIYGYSMPPACLIDNIMDYFYRRWQWRVEKEWLVLSPGLGVAIHNVTRMVAREQQAVGLLIPAPIYHAFRLTTGFYQQIRQDVNMTLNDDGGWELPLDSLNAAVSPDSRLFHLCNPHNPNGKVYSRLELEAIADFCLRHDLIICSDEVHADIILDEDVLHTPIASLSPEIAKRTITLQSPSKAFNIAGLNFSVVVISDDDLRRRYLNATRGHISDHLNIFGMAAASAAWSGEADDWLVAMNNVLRQNRNRLKSAVDDLPGISMSHLQSTYLAWLNIETLGLTDPPAYFSDHGLGMSAGELFGDNRYMRLNFGCSPDSLEEVIARLTKACDCSNQ